MPSNEEKQVYIQSSTAPHSFTAKVRLDVKTLSETSQDVLTGEFTEFDCNREIADLVIHSGPNESDPYPIMWMNNRQDRYRFTMESEDPMRFEAKRLT